MARTFDIATFNSQVKRLISDLHTKFTEINVRLAQSAVPLITNRIINEGKTADGKSLGKYSERPISALYFIGKSLGSGAERSVEAYAKKHKGKISYEKFRELNGRPTNHVTLSFSGETLEDIGVLQTTATGLVINTTVGSLNRKHKDIIGKGGKKKGTISTGEVLEQLNDKYGNALDTDLLELAPDEEKIIQTIFERELQTFLDHYFE